MSLRRIDYNFLPLGKAWGMTACSRGWTFTCSCFSTGVSRTFFTAAGRFLNRGGCCRHAAHDGGDGDNGKEENSFSDGHWLQTHQGEADSIRHGFLCLPHPLAASTSGGRHARRYPPTAPLHLIMYIERTSLPTSRHEKAPDRVGAVPSTRSCFFYRRQPDFFYGRRPLFEPWGMLSSCSA